MDKYLLSCLLSVVSGLLVAMGLWRFAKAVLDQSGTLLVWAGRLGGIVGLGTALWLAGREGFVSIVLLFFATACVTLGGALLARKWRLR